MTKRYVADLQDGDKLQEVFLCKQLKLRQDRNGRHYLTLVLSDRTGAVEALLWDEAENRSRRCNESDLVQVSGKVVLFQGRLQLHLSDLQKADGCDIPMDQFLSQPHRRAEDMFSELTELLGSIKDAELGRLATALLDDTSLMEALGSAPAARSIHHAYPGGLLEHTLSVMQLVDAICAHYGSMLNRDYCLLGALLHDLGKVQELTVDEGLHYTDEGRLVGHLLLGLRLLDDKLRSLDDFPAEAAMHLRHILLAHHGKLEHGSPKRPKTMEALVVHRADELDSVLTSFNEVLQQPRQGGWTAFQPLFDRYLCQVPR